MGRKNKKLRGKREFDCELCKEKKKDDVVACDQCNKWFHFGCVNIASIGAEDSWLCPNCKKDASSAQTTTNVQQNPTDESVKGSSSMEKKTNDSDRKPEKSLITEERDRLQDFEQQLPSRRPSIHQNIRPSQSRSSWGSNASIIRRQIELEQIEEERELEQRYLDKKYRILLTGCENVSASKITDRSRYTDDWVETLSRGRSDSSRVHAPIRAEENEIQDFSRRNLIDVHPDNISVRASERDPCDLRNTGSHLEHRLKPRQELDVDARSFRNLRINDTCNETHVPQVSRNPIHQFASQTVPTSFAARLPYGQYEPQVSMNPMYRFASQTNPTSRSEKPPCEQDIRVNRFQEFHGKNVIESERDPNCARIPLFPIGITTTKQFDPVEPKAEKFSTSQPDPSPESSQLEVDILTKQQIASRHVVTKDLPHFDGKPEDWPMFISRYNNSTKLCGYTNEENLDRLQKCLKRNAFTAVRSRLFSSESVSDIIATLRMLYGRPELVINALLRKLRQVPPPREDKLNTWVDFALAVKNVSATIEQADLQSHLGNPLLMSELVDKLPTTAKIEWAKYKANILFVTIVTLGDWLYELAKTISTVTEPTLQDAQDYKRENSKKDSYVSQSVGYVNVHQENSSTKKDKEKPSTQSNIGNVSTNSSECLICQKKCAAVEACPTFLAYNVDQRWTEIYNKKLCRKCLSRHSRYCSSTKDCGVNKCNFKHHKLLHDEKKHSKENSSSSSNKNNFVSKSTNFHNTFDRKVLLRIIPVVLHCNDRYLNTFAYLDEGSEATMMNTRIAEFFGIKGTPEPLCLIWTDNVHRNEKNSHRVSVHISGNRNSRQYRLNGVRTVENLGLPLQTLIKADLVGKFPYLENVPLEDYVNANAEILIGSDMVSLLSQLEVVEGEMNQPVATRSRLGWSLYGCISSKASSSVSMNPHGVMCPYQSQRDEVLHQMVKEFFKIENFGVQVNNQLNECSKEDERALALLEKFTVRKNDRYEASLLWKYDKFELPSSYGMAMKRLVGLEKHKPDVISSINDIIQDYISKRYARKLSEAEKKTVNAKTWYLPIFIAYHPKKPDKLRLVFDAAAKVKGISLNSMLLTGPHQMASMVNVLRRFREKCIAMAADIKEMYHQVEVRDEDKNSQRFLWRNGDTTKEPEVFVMGVLTFGSKCSPSTAQHVKNRNASEFEKQHPVAVYSIVNNHYVDDLLDCQHTVKEAVQLYNDIKKIHVHGGFAICKFISNSTEAMNAVGEQDDGKEKCLNPDKDFLYTDRVLGMYWNRQKDIFTFSLKYTNINRDILTGLRNPTKRELLKTLMTIFDPLGLISHFLIHLKIILQDVWRAQMTWDEPLSKPEIIDAWKSWLEILPNVEKVEIARVYSLKMTPNTPKSIEYHIFVDASENAFTAVAFLRVEDDDGVDCTLIGSKARVAPLKYLSVPRLELQGGVLGCRLLTSIAAGQTFKANRRIIWSDSSTVLSWIRSDHRKYHQFVAHRIGEILDTTEVNEWRYVPSKLNVADDATKWNKPPSFESTDRWFTGPEFLKLSEEHWPQQPQKFEETSEEMKVHHAHAQFYIPMIVVAERFSSWNRLVRAVAYVKRYVSILLKKIRKEPIVTGPLNREELAWSRLFIIKQAQHECFPEEMVTLARNKILPECQQRQIGKSSSIFRCSPILDENGLLRLRGRLDAAKNIPDNMKRPIILPRDSQITRLLVGCFHRMYHHRNNGTVINELHQQFYISRIRQVLNSVRMKDCQRCKNRDAKPVVPEMGSLPFGRLAVGFRPFSYIGIDYFGPMQVVVGRTSRKRWGVLITCLTIRAVHIEIAHSLDTESCIMCIRNFMAFRGTPIEIFSDCGSNFVGANNELTDLVADLDMDKMATHFTTCYTSWNFNPPKSAYMGGSWERLVRSVKTSLYEIYPYRHPSDEMLRNLMMEAMNVVNSRPLTFIPIDNEEDEALTPNHFIHGNSNGKGSAVPYEMDGPELKSQWRENQRLTDLFWSRFIKEYLPTITRRTKWFQQVDPITVGDIVLIVDEVSPRNDYPKARVLNTMVGSNGQVRRAEVQRADKAILWRPASGLAKLDIQSKGSVGLAEITQGSETGESVVNASYPRPKTHSQATRIQPKRKAKRQRKF